MVAALHTGCATILGDRSYPVTITSEPPGAKVEAKDQKGVSRFTGVTPTTAILDSGVGYFTRARYTVTTTKEGYSSAQQQLSSSVSGWYWGNILFGGLIGMLIVDPATGAMYEIDNSSVNLSMARSFEPSFTTPAYSRASDDSSERLLRLKALREEGVLSDAEYQAKKKAILKDM